MNIGDGTKHSSRDLSQVGFQIPGLHITVYTSSYSVYRDPASLIFFSNGTKHSASQKLVSAQLDKTKSSGSHHTEGPGITLLWLIGGCISLVAEVIPVHIAP